MKQHNKNENEDNASTEGLYTSESSVAILESYFRAWGLNVSLDTVKKATKNLMGSKTINDVDNYKHLAFQLKQSLCEKAKWSLFFCKNIRLSQNSNIDGNSNNNTSHS